MAIRDDLLTDIRNQLGIVSRINLNRRSAHSDIFEVYIFALILEAAVNEGASILYRNINGQVTNHFIFRSSPGFIYSARRPYTHAEILFPNSPVLEAHVGIRVAGRSGVLHECDVAVIDYWEAETCRANLVVPRASSVRIAVECKFYFTNLKLDLARSFLGLNLDLSHRETHYFITNSSSQTVERFLSKKNRKWGHNVIPMHSNEVNKLRSNFESSFQNFKAKN